MYICLAGSQPRDSPGRGQGSAWRPGRWRSPPPAGRSGSQAASSPARSSPASSRGRGPCPTNPFGSTSRRTSPVRGSRQRCCGQWRCPGPQACRGPGSAAQPAGPATITEPRAPRTEPSEGSQPGKGGRPRPRAGAGAGAEAGARVSVTRRRAEKHPQKYPQRQPLAQTRTATRRIGPTSLSEKGSQGALFKTSNTSECHSTSGCCFAAPLRTTDPSVVPITCSSDENRFPSQLPLSNRALMSPPNALAIVL